MRLHKRSARLRTYQLGKIGGTRLVSSVSDKAIHSPEAFLIDMYVGYTERYLNT
jgi:hypothetical protein